MPNVLIVVHGMGVHETGWARSVVNTLNAVARRYELFAGDPPPFLLASDASDSALDAPNRDQVIVVPAGYDAVMRERVESFQKDVESIIDAPGAGALPAEMVSVLRWFKNAGATERNFFWTHVVDVLLYRYFAAVTKPVRLAVMDTVAQVLRRRDVDLSIMAHSLGTAVTHDALAALAGGSIPELGGLRPPGVRISHLFTIANVSRILEKAVVGDLDVYGSAVAPVSVRGDDAFCHAFHDFRHMLDPFPVPKRFEPQWSDTDFKAVDRLLHVGDFNVHGWEHYLDNPEVHIPIINALARVSGWEVIDRATAHTAIESYRAAPVPLCTLGMDWWTEQTHRIQRRLTEHPTVPELVRCGALFLAVAEGARALCRGEKTVAKLASLAERIP